MEVIRKQRQPAPDKFVASFRCESDGMVGSKDAPIHSVVVHDDGVIEVVIDYWPKQPAPHPAITHCDNCGCDWLDNGLNPVGCPYCKQSEQAAEIEALLRQALDALERGAWDTLRGRNAAFAIRERLGEKA